VNTLTPYSDRWRERTLERMKALWVTVDDVAAATGLPAARLRLYLREFEPTLELADPVDEYLDTLEERAEADALDELPEECVVQHPGVGSPRVQRVDVDLGPLADYGVEFTDRPAVPADVYAGADARIGLARARRRAAP
jgi:hypothetical protein